jgi:hypothetical protein
MGLVVINILLKCFADRKYIAERRMTGAMPIGHLFFQVSIPQLCLLFLLINAGYILRI